MVSCDLVMMFNIIHRLVEGDIPNLLQFFTSNFTRENMFKLVKTNCKNYQEYLTEGSKL